LLSRRPLQQAAWTCSIGTSDSAADSGMESGALCDSNPDSGNRRHMFPITAQTQHWASRLHLSTRVSAVCSAARTSAYGQEMFVRSFSRGLWNRLRRWPCLRSTASGMSWGGTRAPQAICAAENGHPPPDSAHPATRCGDSGPSDHAGGATRPWPALTGPYWSVAMRSGLRLFCSASSGAAGCSRA